MGCFFKHFFPLVMMLTLIFISKTDRQTEKERQRKAKNYDEYFIFFYMTILSLFLHQLTTTILHVRGKKYCLESHSDVRAYSLELESITVHTKSFSWYGRNAVRFRYLPALWPFGAIKTPGILKMTWIRAFIDAKQRCLPSIFWPYVCLHPQHSDSGLVHH